MNNLYKTILFFIPFLLSLQTFGQEKSKKIETINGKKYYLHTIAAGQTLYSISKIYELDKNDIIIENPDVMDGVSVGKVLRVPYNARDRKVASNSGKKELSPPANQTFHIVERGQTVYSISKLYIIKPNELLELNPEAKISIRPGQKLIIPEKKTNEHAAASFDVMNTERLIKEEPISKAKQDEPQQPINAPELSNSNDEILNIAMLLPLFLNNNDSIIENASYDKKEVYPKSLIGLEFYEGFMLASDSIRKSDFSANIHVYDVENDSLLAELILRKQEMKKMNLIVGPFYSSSAQSASAFSKNNKILFVSPFAPSNKVLLSNPFAFKVVSSPASNAEAANDYIFKTKAKENIIALYSENSKDKNVFYHFVKTYKSQSYPDSLKICSSKSGYQSLENLLRVDKENVLVVFVSDQAQVTDIINHVREWSDSKLDVSGRRFSLFGMENWLSFDNLEFETMESLQVHIPSSYFVNYEDENTMRFVRSFRYKYATEPSKFAFEGYDVGMCFLSQLQKSNKDFFNNIQTNKISGLQTNMSFVTSGFESGYENKAVHLLKIEGLKWIKVN